MTDFLAKLIFALREYALLSTLAFAAWGVGRVLLGRLGEDLSRTLSVAVSIVVGLGTLASGITALAALDLLNRWAVGVLLLGAVCAGLVGLRPYAFSRNAGEAAAGARSPAKPQRLFWPAFVVLAVLPFLVKPLRPPLQCDELMYHLPHVALWVREGGLVVNEWVRYPLFAYHYQMLYAAGLLFGTDTTPHLIHALAGALVVFGVFAFADRYFDRLTAVLATVMALLALRGYTGGAYIDLALAMYVSFGFGLLALWDEHGDRRYLLLSALLLGFAVATKYQSLLFLPIWAAVVLFRERRPAVLAQLAAIVVVAGGFWYARNAFSIGNPVHPLAQGVFGYWLWDEGDLRAQLQDARKSFSAIEWPPAYFALALFAPLWWRRADGRLRALVLTTFAMACSWALASGHLRYLLPAFPAMALLAAYTLARCLRLPAPRRLGSWLEHRLERVPVGYRQAAALTLALTFAVLGSRAYWAEVPGTAAQREAILRKELPGYAELRAARNFGRARPLMVGFECQTYYGPPGAIGDTFGPARNRDLATLASTPAALARHLRGLGADAIIVNGNLGGHDALRLGPGAERYFDTLIDAGGVRMYALKDAP